MGINTSDHRNYLAETNIARNQGVRGRFALAFEKRAAEELLATGDPRARGAGDVFDRYPYYGDRQPKR